MLYSYGFVVVCNSCFKFCYIYQKVYKLIMIGERR